MIPTFLYGFVNVVGGGLLGGSGDVGRLGVLLCLWLRRVWLAKVEEWVGELWSLFHLLSFLPPRFSESIGERGAGACAWREILQPIRGALGEPRGVQAMDL